jgi:hypothetical protein
MLPKLKEWHASGTLRLVAVAAMMLACGAPVSAAAKKSKKAPPPDDLPTQISKIARQLWGVSLDESEPLTSQVQKLVLDHMTQWVNAHPPGDAAGDVGGSYNLKLRYELESLFAELRPPIYASVATFDQDLAGKPVLGVGYTLGWSDFDRANVLAIFEARSGGYGQVTVSHFVPDTDLNYQFMEPPAGDSGQLWFVAYGSRMGKSNPQLSAILYSFDGKTLQPLWRTTDVYDGRISFEGNRVVISYLREDEFTQAIVDRTPAVRHEAAYRVTPKGLEVEYDR